MKRVIVLPSLCLALLAAVGCESMKSANPLSPTVAGPIAGVNITAPMPVEPKGTKVAVDKQPVTLTVENSTSSGQRPLSYVFELATDADFTNKVLSRTGITPGDGRTSLRLPDPLATGRSYYWRARAEDGANTGPFSAAANFDVFTPIVIGEPQLVSPALNAKATSLRPTFTFTNVSRSGPVGPISYVIEVSDTNSFATKVAVWTVAEGASQTSTQLPQDGQYSQYLFWHVRAADPTTAGSWSTIFAFSMPDAPPIVITPINPGPGTTVATGDWQSCGSVAGFDLVACVHKAVSPERTVEGAFEVTKRVAWLLRGSGGGLLIKPGGENIVTWKGTSYAAGRICFPDGHIYKVLSDVPTTNGPSWQDNDFVDRSLYVPAVDPR